jgi:mRNA interferase RelE/StbE
MLKITYSKDALRTLQRMPPNEARRIIEKVAAYAARPSSQARNVRALKGRPGYRLRVGDWRVILERDAGGIFVLAVGPRGSVYE